MMLPQGICSLVVVRNINGQRGVGVLCNGAEKRDILSAIALHCKQLINGLLYILFLRGQRYCDESSMLPV